MEFEALVKNIISVNMVFFRWLLSEIIRCPPTDGKYLAETNV